MINVADFGKSIRITGHPEQVAMEFELAAKTVREHFCKCLGEDIGNVFFEEILANARKSDSERDTEACEMRRRMERENPELARMFDSSQLVRDLVAAFEE